MTGRPGKRRRAAVYSFCIPGVAGGRKRQSAKYSISVLVDAVTIKDNSW
jgi:hypothetical protein